MLSQLEQVDLLVVGVPVAANALEARSPVVEGVSANADFRVVEGNDLPLEVGKPAVDTRNSLPLRGRAGKGGESCHHLGTPDDLFEVAVEDVLLPVGEIEELLPGPGERRLRQVKAELRQPELEGVTA